MKERQPGERGRRRAAARPRLHPTNHGNRKASPAIDTCAQPPVHRAAPRDRPRPEPRRAAPDSSARQKESRAEVHQGGPHPSSRAHPPGIAATGPADQSRGRHGPAQLPGSGRRRHAVARPQTPPPAAGGGCERRSSGWGPGAAPNKFQPARPHETAGRPLHAPHRWPPALRKIATTTIRWRGSGPRCASGERVAGETNRAQQAWPGKGQAHPVAKAAARVARQGWNNTAGKFAATQGNRTQRATLQSPGGAQPRGELRPLRRPCNGVPPLCMEAWVATPPAARRADKKPDAGHGP